MASQHLLSLLLAVSLALGCQPATSSPPPVSLLRTEQHQLASDEIGQIFQIDVALPDGYADSDAAYPVLYMLDSTSNFGLVSQLAFGMQVYEEVPQMIIVGIGYSVSEPLEILPLRARDMTPTSDESWVEQQREAPDPWGLPEHFHAGGAEKFLAFIVEDLKPWVDERYRTNAEDSALLGHSFGGLFALYSLFHESRPFNRYVVSSPSLWWDSGFPFQREEQYAETHDDLMARVFISAGELEEDAVPEVQRMSRVLEGREYPNLAVEMRVFPGETHASTLGAVASHGLRSVYRP